MLVTDRSDILVSTDGNLFRFNIRALDGISLAQSYHFIPILVKPICASMLTNEELMSVH